MKIKKTIILFLSILLITGCKFEKIDTSDRDNLVGYITAKDYKIYNRYSIGYKYYLPKSVSVINYSDYNEQLLSNGDIYYLYIDITSYYYKNKLEIDKPNNCVYYKHITNDGKEGYVKVLEYEDNKYYVIYQYNYAKIETIINKKNLDNTLINLSYILSSIKYNDSIVNSIFENSLDVAKEEVFELVKPNNNENTFLDYVNTYDNYENEDDELTDESTIKNTKDSDID